MFSAFGSNNLNLPVTDWLTDRVISLPIHTEMEDDQLKFITNEVKTFIQQQ
jgi:dTDP-4-amino-4,6-dideoxygalactose transaminase